MNVTITGYYSRIRYFTSPSLSRAIVEGERPGEANSAITGGCKNIIGSNGGQHNSFIGGGESNCIISGGIYSAILGGKGNTVSHNYSGVFGCNVATVCGCTFHANNFAAQNMASTSGGPSGTFYYVNCSGTCFIAINP